MDLIPALSNWNCCARRISVPHITLQAIHRLQESGIGTLFTSDQCKYMSFVVLNDLEDLATMHAILGGDCDGWKGTTDDQLLLRALTGYIESHPEQEGFCFVAFES